MITNILTYLVTLIIHIISSLGYGGVILLMTLHSMAIPVPSEVVIPFAGFLVSTGRFNYFAVVLSGTLGNLIGASLIYALIYNKGRNFLLRYEKFLFISQNEVELAEKFFHRFGSVAIFFGRCIPIVATFISIPAGLARVKYWKFATFTVLGAIIWNLVLTYIGMKLGENWIVLREKLHGAELVIAGLIVVGIVFWVWRHLRNRSK